MSNCLMIQGTGSSVGKSFIVAGLCRYLYNKGLAVAPYKSQNMSLNSAVSVECSEISRAQAMQAEAAKTPAIADMNPILLKPMADKHAQLIVKGKVLGNYTASQYHKMKLSLLDECISSLDNLRANFEAIVMEGAGSPAEINLMNEDIANMKIAQAADAPVILVGDIDKGGVFASLYGTYKLLPKEDRERVAGFIINKFRGDKDLLKDGVDFIESKTGIKVLGVLPYEDIELDAEDSANLLNQTHGEIDIGVVKLPKISNFTDFWALQKEKDVGLRFTVNPKELKAADCIIIPGSKSVTSDLLWVKSKGLDKAIAEAAKSGTFVVGICGGFQMLGSHIHDKEGVESAHLSIEGLNLFDIKTTFQKTKTTKQTKAIVANSKFEDLNGHKVVGYEIHNGVSISNSPCLFKTEGSNLLGLADGNILGTYLHGLFDNNNFRRTFVNIIRESKGLEPIEDFYDFARHKEEQYEKLAKLLDENMDLESIFDLLNINRSYVKQTVAQGAPN